MRKDMKFFKKSDIIILVLIAAVSLSVWAVYKNVYAKKAAKAEIFYKNQLVETVDLSMGEDRRFSVPQDPNVVFHVYEDGSIRFEESDCPDKICVKTGRLRTVGETAACIPNKLFLKIVEANKRESDTDNRDNDKLDGISG